MIKINKLTALLLCFAMLLGALPVFGTDGDIKWVCKTSTRINSDGELTYPTVPEGYGEYFTDWGGISVDSADWWGHALHIGNSSGWLSYDVPVEEKGVYELFVTAGTYENYPATVETFVDEVKASTATIDTCDWEPNTTVSLGCIPLIEGNNSIKISFNVTSGGTLALQYFSLRKMPAPSISGYAAGESVLNNGDTIPRGTDNIKLSFSNMLNGNPSEEAVISLTDTDGNEISVKQHINENILTISLTKSLDYSRDYTLSVGGVTDAFGYKTEEAVIEFNSSDSDGDTGTSTAEITYSPDLYNSTEIVVEGMVKNSLGDGIEGRNASLEIKNPDGETISTINSISGENGKVSFSYFLDSEAEAGKYKLSLSCEYGEASDSKEVRYISEKLKNQILGEIKNTASETDVKTLFETYYQELGIDLSELDEERNSEDEIVRYGLSDKDEFFLRFKGKEFLNLDAFSKAYEENLAIEVFIQNNSASARKDILENEKYAKPLEFDKERISLLSEENKPLFWADSESLTKNEADTKEKMNKALEAISNKYFLMQYGKGNINLSVDSASVYEGQQAELLLKCDLVTDLTGYELEVFSSGNFADNLNIGLKNGEESQKIKNDASVSFNVTLRNGDCTELGKILYDTEGEEIRNFKVLGKAIYKKADFPYLMYADISPCEFTLSVTKNKSHAAPSYSSTSSGGGKRPSGGTGGAVTKPSDEEKTAFTDLTDVSWAESSIEYLYNKGVISKSEDNKFRPSDNVTRAEFIKMLVMTLGIYDESAKTAFNDIKNDDWYFRYVASAEKNGLIIGNEFNLFNPEKAITRQDICVILSRSMDRLGYENKEYAPAFDDDSSISDYAKNAVYRLFDFKVVNGMGNNIFAPQSFATRAMTAKMLVEFLKGVEAQ